MRLTAARGSHMSQFTRIAATTAIFGNLGVDSVDVAPGIGTLINKAIKVRLLMFSD